MLIFPFFICRLYEFFKGKKKEAFFGLCQDFFIAAEFLLLSSFFPFLKPFWFLVCLISLSGWFLSFRFEIPFTFDLLKSLSDFSSYKDSLRTLKIFWLFPTAILLIAFSFLGWNEVPFLLLAPLGWAGFFLQDGHPNPLFRIQFFRKKKTGENSSYSWKFPNEVSHFLNPEYPLLRKTVGFKGKKRFHYTEERPNIVFLFLESFRAKNVGCLGASLAASPQFDALAKQGALFRNFCASGTQTYRAFLSSFFGIQPHLDTMSLKSYSSIPLIGLPKILKQNGYQTALMQGGSAHFDWTFPFFKAHGFETILGREELAPNALHKNSWGVSDEDLYKTASHWMDEQTKPFFLSLFTISNHHPWDPPLDWNFSCDPSLPLHYKRFLQTFSYADHALGQFLQKPRENTLFFILGDHGQGMGERKGPIELHNDLYQENIHVPLLILGKGIQPSSIDTPASPVDLLPTVLDLLQLEAIHHSVGKSLVREENRPIYFSTSTQRGCLKENLKYISPNECYDLSQDAEERENLHVLSLQKETDSYFNAIEELFEKNQWAPTQSIPSPRIDLSRTTFSDRAVFAIDPSLLHELDLSHSLFTDQALTWVADNCPHLHILNLSYSPLFTEAGIAQVLQKCPHLRELNLEGNDLPDFDCPPTQLAALRCPPMKTLIQNSPHLVFLSTEKLTLSSLPHTELQTLVLTDSPIDTPSLETFCLQNPDLSILHLYTFPLLTHLPSLPRLRHLKLSHCPRLETLSPLRLEECILIHCPSLQASSLQTLAPCKIILNHCPQFDRTTIESLLAKGIEIY